MSGCCSLIVSVLRARIGRRIEEGCLFYKSRLRGGLEAFSTLQSILNDMPYSEKEKEEKPEKEEKGLPFQPDLDGPSETGYLCGLFVSLCFVLH